MKRALLAGLLLAFILCNLACERGVRVRVRAKVRDGGITAESSTVAEPSR